MYVTTSFVDNLILAGLIEHVMAGNYSGPLYGAMLGLFGNNIQPTKSTDYTALGELTVGALPGYAEVALAPWTTPVNEGDGTLTMVSAACEFRATAAPSATVTAYGAMIVDATGPPPNLLAAELFPAAKQFQALGDGFIMVVSWNEHPNNPATLSTIIT